MALFRNSGGVDLIVLSPGAVVKPGETIDLPKDPGHRDLVPVVEIAPLSPEPHVDEEN